MGKIIKTVFLIIATLIIAVSGGCGAEAVDKSQSEAITPEDTPVTNIPSNGEDADNEKTATAEPVEPVIDIVPEEKSEALEKYYDYILNNPQFTALMNRSVSEKGITDEDMASFALIHTKVVNGEAGGTIDEFNAITDKYFNKRIENFNNNYSAIEPGTDYVVSTGWGYSHAYLVLKDLKISGDGITAAEFYMMVRQPGDELDWPEDDEAGIKEDLLSGNFEGYGPFFPAYLEFIEKYDENEDMYFQVISAYQDAEVINEKPVPYGTGLRL